MLNNPALADVARQPRGLAIINGVTVTGLVSFDVDNNSFYQADTFRATIALSAQPQATNWAWWASQKSMALELFAGFPPDPDNYTKSDLQSLILGNIDEIEIDPVADEITVTGRDFTSKFIDAQTNEKFMNLTSSAIVAKIAARHGMKTVISETTVKAGNYYTIDQVRLTKRQSEWDLVTYLANQEDFSVYVKGNTLYFNKKASVNDDPYVIQWQQSTDTRSYSVLNAISINFSRNLTLAKDIAVIFASSNPKTKKPYTVKRTATHTKNTLINGATQAAGEVQTYFRSKPGLTVQETIRRAESLLRELTAHEIKLHVEMPADTILGTQNIIKVVGTGTAFDQVYFPDSITRSYGLSSGYRMSVSAKNHSVESEIAG